jgi:hypothetical protein
MRRIESHEDAANGIVTYRLDDGRHVRLDAFAVREYGARVILAAMGIEEKPGERVPVMQHGRRVGTVPSDFDPIFAKSKTWLYDVRPEDFKRTDDGWLASRTLGPGDLEAVAGFRWD